MDRSGSVFLPNNRPGLPIGSVPTDLGTDSDPVIIVRQRMYVLGLLRKGQKMAASRKLCKESATSLGYWDMQTRIHNVLMDLLNTGSAEPNKFIYLPKQVGKAWERGKETSLSSSMATS